MCRVTGDLLLALYDRGFERSSSCDDHTDDDDKFKTTTSTTTIIKKKHYSKINQNARQSNPHCAYWSLTTIERVLTSARTFPMPPLTNFIACSVKPSSRSVPKETLHMVEGCTRLELVHFKPLPSSRTVMLTCVWGINKRERSQYSVQNIEEGQLTLAPSDTSLTT